MSDVTFNRALRVTGDEAGSRPGDTNFSRHARRANVY